MGSSKGSKKKCLTVPGKVIITNIEILPTREIHHSSRSKRSPWFGRHSGGHGRRPHIINWGESQFGSNTFQPVEKGNKKRKKHAH